MSSFLSSFKKLDGVNDVFVAQKGDLRCSAFMLKSGSLCIFSPVQGLSEDAILSLKNLGKVEFLLAPNHYHNKGLLEYHKIFPKAKICAPQGAHLRLQKITGLQFEDLTNLKSALKPHIFVKVPEGLKTGEVWICINDPKQKTWFVVDAFSGQKGKKQTIVSEPELLGTFPKFGISDKKLYVKWLEQQIKADKPTMIVPCHGAIILSAQLPDKIINLINSKL